MSDTTNPQDPQRLNEARPDCLPNASTEPTSASYRDHPSKQHPDQDITTVRPGGDREDRRALTAAPAEIAPSSSGNAILGGGIPRFVWKDVEQELQNQMSRGANMSSNSITTSTQQKTQVAFLLCGTTERPALQQIMSETEAQLIEQGPTILLYGVTSKRQEGFLIIEAARGFPSNVARWLRARPDILDCVIYDVPSFEQEHQARAEAKADQIAQELLTWARNNQLQVLPDSEREGLLLIPVEEENDRNTENRTQQQAQEEDENSGKGQQQPEEEG